MVKGSGLDDQNGLENIRFCPNCDYQGTDLLCPVCNQKMISEDEEMDRIIKEQEEDEENDLLDGEEEVSDEILAGSEDNGANEA